MALGGFEERKALRRMLASGKVVVAPCAYDAFTARLVEALGFKAICLGGMATGHHLGIIEPLVTLTEQAEVARRVASACNLPVFVDAHAGYGEPVHVQRTVHEFEDAGVAAIHIEDQIYPKRVSYFREVEHVIPLDEFLIKMEYALKARRDDNFVIVARTDAYTAQGGGREECIRRALALKELGVDGLMLRGVNTREEISDFREAIPDIPFFQIAGAKWPDLSVQEYEDLGVQMVDYATSPIVTAGHAIWENYQCLLETGKLKVPGGSEEYWEQRRVLERIQDLDGYLGVEAATSERETQDVPDPFANVGASE